MENHREKLLSKKTPAEYRFEKILQSLGVRYIREFVVKTKRGKMKYLDFFVGRKLSAKNKDSKKALRINKSIPYYGIGFEIDGGIHNNQQYYDINRDTQIIDANHHIFIFRFTNEDIFETPDMVKGKVKEVLGQMHLLHS